MKYPDFLSTQQARKMFGDDYADYIQRTEEDYIERGILTLEYAQTATLGERLAGNDGI